MEGPLLLPLVQLALLVMLNGVLMVIELNFDQNEGVPDVSICRFAVVLNLRRILRVAWNPPPWFGNGASAAVVRQWCLVRGTIDPPIDPIGCFS